MIDEGLRPYATPRQWEVYCAVQEHGSQRAAARALGCVQSNISTALTAMQARAAQRGYSPDHDMTHPAPEGFRVKGTSTLYDLQSGEARMQWVKTASDGSEELIREAVDAFAADLVPVPPVLPPEVTMDHLMTVIPMGDPHFGLYCWAKETGNDFDLDIAKRDLCGAVSYLVKQVPQCGRCVIINLGDFFHADNMEGTTKRSGHKLDTDSRLPKVIDVGVAALRQCIASALEHHATVEVINVVGNHDDVLAYALSVMMANIYENEPRVVIHGDPTPRHYIQHGKNLIGVTHGHQTKDAKLPGIMAAEKPQEWGATRFRTFYRGHFHSDMVDDSNPGCRVEGFRTLSPGDAWAVGNGYLSGQDMKAIVHHKEYGEMFRYVCGISLLRDLQKA